MSESMPSASRRVRPMPSSASPAGIGAADLARFRAELVHHRAELLGDISALMRDALTVTSVQPSSNHLAEGGSDTDLQGTSLGLADEDQETLRLIDRALDKLDGKHPMPFGLCEYTRAPIARERLDLMPWTPLSIEGATYLEENFLTLEDLAAE